MVKCSLLVSWVKLIVCSNLFDLSTGSGGGVSCGCISRTSSMCQKCVAFFERICWRGGQILKIPGRGMLVLHRVVSPSVVQVNGNFYRQKFELLMGSLLRWSTDMLVFFKKRSVFLIHWWCPVDAATWHTTDRVCWWIEGDWTYCQFHPWNRSKTCVCVCVHMWCEREIPISVF